MRRKANPMAASEESSSLESSSPSFTSGVVTALPVALAGGATGIVGVVVTVLLARILSNQGYGSYAQLISIFLIVSMPGSALIVAVVRRTASWRTAGSHVALRDWAKKVHDRMHRLLGIFVALVIVLSYPLSMLMAKRSPVSMALVLIAAGVWVVLCIDRGFLQGTQQYRGLAMNYLVEGVVRTALVLAFGVLFKLPGVAIGIFLGEAITALHARRCANAALEKTTGDGLAVVPPSIRRDIVVDLVAALAALALLALLQNIDVLILGHVNPHQSGEYAAVSIACKSLVYAAVVLGSYLLPEAALSHQEGDHALRQLAITLGILAIPATILIVMGEFFPGQIIKLVYGARYLGAESAFGPLAVAMTFLSITFLVVMYLLAHANRWIVGLLGLAVVVGAIAIHFAHGVPLKTAQADLFVQIGLCALSCIGLMVAHRRLKRSGKPLLTAQPE